MAVLALTAAAAVSISEIVSGPGTAEARCPPWNALLISPGLPREADPGPQPVAIPSLLTGYVRPTKTPGGDDTTAVQRALDVAAGRLPVLLDARTYRISRSLTLPPGTRILGRGPSSVLQFTWYAAMGPASGGAAYLETRPGQPAAADITLANFAIAGAGNGTPSGKSDAHPTGLASGVRLVGVRGFSIEHMQIRNTPGIAVSYLDSSDGVISANDIENSGRDGITGFYTGFGGRANVTISCNRLSRLGDDGIAVDGAANADEGRFSGRPSGFAIENNAIDGWPRDPNGRQLGRGIAIVAATDAVVTRNVLSGSASDGILVAGAAAIDPELPAGTGQASRIAVIGNAISGAGRSYSSYSASSLNLGAGLYVVDSDRVDASSNLVAGSRGQPSVIRACVSCSVAAPRN